MKNIQKYIALFCCFFLGVCLFAQEENYWIQKPGGNLGAAISVKVNQQNHIFVSVIDKGIFRSLDSGTTWMQVAPFAYGTWSFEFDSQGKIFASLWSKGIYISSDNGSTWSLIETNMLNADIRLINSYDQIFIESSGKTFRSSNGGARWQEIKTVNFGTGTLLPNKKMYAAKNTSLAVSNDNGVTWNSQQIISSAYALCADTYGRIFVGTYCDELSRQPSILLYDSLSSQWVRTGPKSTINALVRHATGRIFAATHDSGVYVHDDTSGLWVQKNGGLTTTKIYSIAFLRDSIVVAGTLDGIFISSNVLTDPLPVELVSFTAKRIGMAVELRWTTATETNNAGFAVERAPSQTLPLQGGGQGRSWKQIGFVEGAGSSNATKNYLFIDKNISGEKYLYRLKQIDRDGAFHYSQEIEVTAVVPTKFVLEQNYPNPFNPSTVISYQLPENNYVTLKIFDALGREVATLVNEQKEAGRYSVEFNASHLASGVYYYSLKSGNYKAVKKLVLVK